MEAVGIMVMRELPRPRPTFLLKRGAYDAPLEQVTPTTPGIFPPFLKDQPGNRLGLARWLTSRSHPLTSRVSVNRFWQLCFGAGLVRTARQSETMQTLDGLERKLTQQDLLICSGDTPVALA